MNSALIWALGILFAAAALLVISVKWTGRKSSNSAHRNVWVSGDAPSSDSGDGGGA